MHIVIGPVLTREGGYAFDLWTPEEGLSAGYVYRCINDAHHARNVEIGSYNKEGQLSHAIVCGTVEQFMQTICFTRRLFPEHDMIRSM